MPGTVADPSIADPFTSTMTVCSIVSFRLGGTDGVSIVADRWRDALQGLGFGVRTVAGEGPVDTCIPDLAIGRWPDGRAGLVAPNGASDADMADLRASLRDALSGSDLVIVENLGTIPMNLPAATALAEVRRGLPTLWHHHDPAWQRDRYDGDELPLHPGDRAWRHVAITDVTREQLRARGVDAVTIHNCFDTHAPSGDRAGERARHGFGADELVLVHPVRAIARKNIGEALRITRELGGTYWLTGPAEEGYERELAALLDDAADVGVRIVHEPAAGLDDLYAAADVVLFPSSWEGFGNPPVEAAIHRRPAVVGDYPVADELRAMGFRWFHPDRLDQFRAWLDAPDTELLEHNWRVADRHLSLAALTDALRGVLDEAGWLP